MSMMEGKMWMQRGSVCHECGDDEHLACSSTYVGNGRGDQSHDDEGNEELEQLVENATQGVHASHGCAGNEEAEDDTEGDGDDDTNKKGKLHRFRI